MIMQKTKLMINFNVLEQDLRQQVIELEEENRRLKV